MNTFIHSLEEQFNYKFTENGAIAMESTGSKVYDLFALGGAYRTRSEEDCILLFKNAFEEDKTLALKALFYLRDCRGGQGERRFFRICFKWLAIQHPEVANNLFYLLPEYGRWDDLFVLFDTSLQDNMLNFIIWQLTKDMLSLDKENQAVSLLAKWLPSENAHSKEGKIRAAIIRNFIGCTPKEYRKMLSELRERINVLERLMSAGRWDEIKFDKIPSKAGLVYRNAFARRDIIAQKYREFVQNKNTKVNADTLYPYEVVEKAIGAMSYDGWYNYGYEYKFDDIERAMINKYWENLPDYLEGKDPSMLCVIDTSGSMYGRPINIAISLGLYCAERMTGPFANKYISFSSRPQLIKTEGMDFCDKVQRIYRTNLCENTDLPAVFDLLLQTALKKGVKKSDLPETIVVISDMEIDYMSARRGWTEENTVTEMEKIRKKWAFYGLKLPKLVYWNVNARNNTILDKGPNVSFVSGSSPVIFKQVLTGKTGVELMLEVLLGKRYEMIK